MLSPADRTGAGAMFHHVVLMKLKGADARFHARVADYVARVRRELPYVRAFHYGRNVADRSKGHDWAVYAAFDTSADHDRYQVSPVHQEMKAFMMEHIEEIVVCDMSGGDSEQGARA
jgi:hypothetical protein